MLSGAWTSGSGLRKRPLLASPLQGGDRGGLTQRHVEHSQPDAGGQQARVLLAQGPQGVAGAQCDGCQVIVHVG